jgi:serine/threonine protein kinase
MVKRDDGGFNEYRLVKKSIGQGGNVCVCEREDRTLYAVKTYDKRKAEGERDLCPITRKFTNRLNRMRQEVDILSTLYQRNVLLTYEIVEGETTIKIVSECLKPSNCCWDAELKAFTHQCLSERKCHEYFCDILQALRYLKEKRICHGDIRPSNICFNNMNEAVLCDFGEATRFKDEDSTIRTQYGTKEFWSPEKVSCGPSGYDGYEADMYAASVTLWVWHRACLPKRLRVDHDHNIPLLRPCADSKLFHDFLEKVLSVNRMDRLRCVGSVLKHDWIGGEIAIKRRVEGGNALRRHHQKKKTT